LAFQSHHKIFIRRSWYSVLPSLDATISCHISRSSHQDSEELSTSFFSWRSDEIKTSK